MVHPLCRLFGVPRDRGIVESLDRQFNAAMNGGGYYPHIFSILRAVGVNVRLFGQSIARRGEKE